MPGSSLCMFHYCSNLDDRIGRPRSRSERELLRAAAHSQPRKEPITFRRFSLLCITALSVASIAAADSVSFSGSIGGQPKSVGVPILARGTVNYISLTDLVAGFGGKTTLQTDRVQVDLADGQAWLKLNQTSVNSALESFDLRQPVLREGDAVLVAVTDAQPFLRKAFGATTTQQVNRDSNVSADELGVSVNDMARTAAPTPRAAPVPRTRSTEIHVAFIDPGHGGSDYGIEPPGAAAGTREKDIALAVALRVRERLEQQLGIQVRMSRDEDLMLSNNKRMTLANRDGDVLVSLHAGASASATASGFELFYSPVAPGMSAEAIAYSLSDALTEATGTPSRGVREARLSLFREIEMPGVLIELGFLTNTADATLLVDPEYQQKIAEGIAAGLAPFVKAPAAASGTP